jgi:uncharacterized membrane protein
MLMLNALLAFIGMFACDFFYARYTKHVAKSRAMQASNCAALLLLMGGVVTLTYVGNHWMLIPAVAGAWIGTFYGCKS